MKDLQRLFEECMKELAGIGIGAEPILSVTVNTRAKKRWGQAKKVPGGWEINISSQLLQDDLPDTPAKTVLIHEILHCRWNGTNHYGYWRALADKVNRELGYRIRTTDTRETLGLPPLSEEEKADAAAKVKKRTGEDVMIGNNGQIVRYVVECAGCGARIERSRMSKVVKYPGRYRCARCGGRFRRVR